ncbi:MAG: hypothetical protein K1X82_07170 [Bacteroidia bacterium]|nr:hypothetical protein [Bacteroidia bacterium]
MKTSNFILGVISAFILIGCGKEEPIDTSAYGKIEFHMHSTLGVREIPAYGLKDTMPDGRGVLVQKARMYISHIELQKKDGTLVPLDGKIILTERGIEAYELGDAPAGNYNGVRFYIGLDASQNTRESVAGDQVLGDEGMWFSTNPQVDGRKYIHFVGKVDTSLAGNPDSTQWKPFDFQLGTSNHYQQVVLPVKNYSIIPGQTHFVHLEIDFGKLLSGLDWKTSDLQVVGVGGNSTSLSQDLKLQAATMIGYED